MRHAVARKQEQRVKPAFTVKELEGTYSKTIHLWSTKDKKIVSKKIDAPAGYLVTFAKGHSNRLSEAELDRLMKGDESIALVDMETGEEIDRIAA